MFIQIVTIFSEIDWKTGGIKRARLFMTRAHKESKN